MIAWAHTCIKIYEKEATGCFENGGRPKGDLGKGIIKLTGFSNTSLNFELPSIQSVIDNKNSTVFPL
jgi:hypothetical protein